MFIYNSPLNDNDLALCKKAPQEENLGKIKKNQENK